MKNITVLVKHTVYTNQLVMGVVANVWWLQIYGPLNTNTLILASFQPYRKNLLPTLSSFCRLGRVRRTVAL